MHPPTGPTRVVVIGAGISGLSAAWFLRQALGESAEIVVLEKGDRIGGALRVSEVAGLPVDEGAESLLARRPEALDLARAVGLEPDIVHPAPVGAGLWSRGRIWPMPAGTIMGVPADPTALAGILTADEVAAAAADASLPGLPIDDDVAVGELVAARMGRGVVDRLVEPLLGGVYAGHADQLSVDATVPALGAAVREHTSLRDAVQAVQSASVAPAGPVFAGLVGGVGRLPVAVAEAAGAIVRTGVTVRELRPVMGGWELVSGPVPHPQIVTADAVVLAVPPAAAGRLLRGVADQAATELAAVESASMAIVTLAVPSSAFRHLPASSGFLVPPVDGHVIKAVTFSSVKWPWLGQRADDVVLLRASIGRHGQVADLQHDDAELVAATMADLERAMGLNGAPIDARVIRWGGALPQYAVGHLGRVQRIRESISDISALAACGAVFEGVGVPACIASARRAVDRVVADLSTGHVRIEA